MSARLLRASATALGLVSGVAMAYLALLVFPEPLFPVAVAHASTTFRSRTPMDGAALGRIADQVEVRVRDSELYDAAVHHRVFVVGDRALWTFLNGPYRGAIARNIDLGNAILVPRLEAREGWIVHFDGRHADAVGILAHEVMHTFMERHVGPRYWGLPRWKREGYPEYVGSNRATRLESPPSDRAAALAWKHLLEDRRMTFDEIIATPMTVEQALRR